MNNQNGLKNQDILFDNTLLDELDGLTSDGNKPSSEPEKSLKTPGPRKEADDLPVSADSGESNAAPKKETDDAERAAKRLFLIRVIAVAVGVLGIIMLISGIALHRLDEESRRTPEKAQMPEEYIEEFFSDENFEPDIEDFIEPEA